MKRNLTGLLLALLFLAGPTWAGEPEAARDLGVGKQAAAVTPAFAPARIRPRFRRELSKIEVQLESISAFEGQTAAGGRASDHVLFPELSDDVRHGVRRATRRAVRDYFLDAVEVDRMVDALRGGAQGGGATGPGGPGRRTSFDVRIHSLEPEVEMGYRLGGGQLKLSVGAEGELGVRFGARGAERANVGLSFDGNDTLRLTLRLGL